MSLDAQMVGAKARVITAVAEYVASTVTVARLSLNSSDPLAQELRAMVSRSRERLDEVLERELEAMRATPQQGA